MTVKKVFPRHPVPNDKPCAYVRRSLPVAHPRRLALRGPLRECQAPDLGRIPEESALREGLRVRGPRGRRTDKGPTARARREEGERSPDQERGPYSERARTWAEAGVIVQTFDGGPRDDGAL